MGQRNLSPIRQTDAPARPPDSIESKQRKLNSIELTVELTRRSPISRIRDLNTIPCLTRSLPGVDGTPMDSTSYQCSTKAKEVTHISTMKKRRKRSHKLDRVSRKRQPQLYGALLMAIFHLQTMT
ncbi:unnamed protein product [Microthlaspi erraticum]|uniref:Uncharacterized protein n=1 Tax=Microthlaspi erraticum TaxID=1685480 RepID=A0A6D2KFI7_9BRAS|nr:unnamed protein product [Microthlaspi erraticum]